MALVELLQQGKIEEFNEKRPMRGKLDLFAADLSGASLAGANLANADLEKADLSGADLSGANLMDARLTGADLTGANLTGIMGLKSRWKEAYLGQADLTGAELSHADLSDAELPDAILRDAVLNSARLRAAVLEGADLQGASLIEAHLNDAVLKGANLTGTSLTGATLARADLTDARLPGVDLSGNRLERANFTRADLSGANLRSANLVGSDFTGAILTQTDLTRADLTEAVTEQADFTHAILTEAQLDGELSTEQQKSVPAASRLLIEDPTVVIRDNRVAVMWENPEPGGSRLRVVVGTLGTKSHKPPYSLPVPLDLVLARAICATSTGFTAAVLVERPAGVSLSLTHFSEEGAVTSQQNLRLGYTPMVRPILREEDGELLLYGISREGPGLIVQRVKGDELDVVTGEAMSNVRGFVSDRDPVVLSKGGVVKVMHRRGVGSPMRAPAAFPGRASASCAPSTSSVALAWAERGRPGLYTALLAPNEAPDESVIFPKKLIGNLTIDADADQDIWAAFTVEPPTPDEPASAWAVSLPGGTPYAILDDQDQDVDTVRFVKGASPPVVALSTLEGQLLLYKLSVASAKLCWTLG